MENGPYSSPKVNQGKRGTDNSRLVNVQKLLFLWSGLVKNKVLLLLPSRSLAQFEGKSWTTWQNYASTAESKGRFHVNEKLKLDIFHPVFPVVVNYI